MMFYLLSCLLVACSHVTYGLLLDDGESSLQAEVIQLKAELAAVKSTLNTVMDSINSECTLQCPKLQSVAFMAQLSATLDNPANGHVVVFDDVNTNVGNAYNPVHGIFTAPFNGTYNFNIKASTPHSSGSHQLHLYIMKNSVKVGYVFLDYNTAYWLQRTTDITVHLTEMDEIWVEVGDIIGNHALVGSGLHTHLSGFLIRSD